MLGWRGVHHGKDWEARVAMQARIEGLLLVSHGSTVRRLSPTKMVAVKSDLDFRIGNTQGDIVFFDTKTFGGKPYATSSQWTRHQIERASLYRRFGQRAGMLVHFRSSDQVVFFDVSVLTSFAGGRFDASNGLCLGNAQSFCLSRLF